ncbi:hypothetical protein AJ79_03758 [Helicocarpus griseus UAMH5409]|uniref:Uncharacterized protein n=1 Tax=Helicocarpus griseus UAMH5409 TaxID=1447875 RepID=A0A2B7XX45_9EURO|nr:hypothetical protein AJ79_03758 [Helicocarpus griseus UAMH5409]
MDESIYRGQRKWFRQVSRENDSTTIGLLKPELSSNCVLALTSNFLRDWIHNSPDLVSLYNFINTIDRANSTYSNKAMNDGAPETVAELLRQVVADAAENQRGEHPHNEISDERLAIQLAQEELDRWEIFRTDRQIALTLSGVSNNTTNRAARPIRNTTQQRTAPNQRESSRSISRPQREAKMGQVVGTLNQVKGTRENFLKSSIDGNEGEGGVVKRPLAEKADQVPAQAESSKGKSRQPPTEISISIAQRA